MTLIANDTAFVDTGIGPLIVNGRVKKVIASHIGTVVEEGKQRITLDNVTYQLERPLRADLALIRAHQADALGNLTYQLSARNFNPLLDLAADITLVEPDELVAIGDISPDRVVTPGALVDYIITPEER